MFGLDLKTAVITAVFILFVLPWIRNAMLSASTKQKTNAQQ